MNEYTTCLYPDSQRIRLKIDRNICEESITAIQFRPLFLKYLASLSYISFCLISFIFMLHSFVHEAHAVSEYYEGKLLALLYL